MYPWEGPSVLSLLTTLLFSELALVRQKILLQTDMKMYYSHLDTPKPAIIVEHVVYNITQTCPCNMMRTLKTVKNYNF